MKFNIHFSIRGPAGTLHDIPNTTNPVECESLEDCLKLLADNLPKGMVVTTGIKVETVDEQT